MAWANVADVNKLLPPDEQIPEEYEPQVKAVLEEATDLVIGHLDRGWSGQPDADGIPADLPGAVRRVVARIALRAFEDEGDNPGAIQSTNLMGPFSHTVNWGKDAIDRSVYLSKGEEIRLAPYMAGGFSGGAGHFLMSGAKDYAF